MSTWYAARTSSNALRHPSRYARIGNGRMRPVACSVRTVVEASLDEAGLRYLLPMEVKTLTHHRTKRPITRRFPLMPGYVFVADIRDFRAFEDLDGVAGVIRVCGQPVRVPVSAIEQIEAAQEAINSENAAIWKARNAKPKALAAIYPSGSRVAIAGGHALAGWQATVVGVTARRTIRTMIEFLGGEVEAELPVDVVELVA